MNEPFEITTFKDAKSFYDQLSSLKSRVINSHYNCLIEMTVRNLQKYYISIFSIYEHVHAYIDKGGKRSNYFSLTGKDSFDYGNLPNDEKKLRKKFDDLNKVKREIYKDIKNFGLEVPTTEKEKLEPWQKAVRVEE